MEDETTIHGHQQYYKLIVHSTFIATHEPEDSELCKAYYHAKGPTNYTFKVQVACQFNHRILHVSTCYLWRLLCNNRLFIDRHRQVRDEAKQSYLKSAQSQLIKYKNNSAKRHQIYDIGDIADLKLSDVDRTNTSSTILSYKIVDKYSKNAELCT
ncbi:unnamed protein product [Rotaria sp. Silwood1]|nr:unnamed protein product [Rotaria sp. Silwood1]